MAKLLHQDVEGVAYVRDRGYVRCPKCGLWAPFKGVSTAKCPGCKHELRVDEGGVRIITQHRDTAS